MGNIHPKKLIDNMTMNKARPLFSEEEFALITEHVQKISRTLDDFTVREAAKEPTLGFRPSANQQQ